MTDPDRYKLAAEKFRFLVHLWLKEDCGCTCSQREELVREADELMMSETKEAA